MFIMSGIIMLFGPEKLTLILGILDLSLSTISKIVTGCILAGYLVPGLAAPTPDIKVVCPNPLPKVPAALSRSDTYKDTPFKAGEVSEFAISWMGMLAGYGTIEIQAPQKLDGIWHRAYHVEGRTGDWFKGIYVANDQASALTRPWDWGVTKFYIEQQEGKFLGKSFNMKKWLFSAFMFKIHINAPATTRPSGRSFLKGNIRYLARQRS